MSGTRVVQPYYWLLGSAAAVVVIAGLRAAHSLVVPFLIAAFLAVICAPVLHWLKKKGVSDWLSIFLVALAVSLVVLVIVAIMTGSIEGFLKKLPTYQDNLQIKLESIDDKLKEYSFWDKNKENEIASTTETLENVHEENASPILDEPDKLQSPDEPSPKNEEEHFSVSTWVSNSINEWVSTSAIFSFVRHVLSSLTGVFGNVFLVLLTVLFIFLESSGFPSKLRALSSGAENLDALAQAEKIRESIVHYISLKTMLSLLTSVLVGIFVWFLEIDFPILWAMLAFFLNFIPNIGSIMAAVLPVLLAFIQYNMTMAVIAAGGYAVINVTIGNVLEPRIMGKGLGLSTLVVFISLIFWGWVLGPVGMLFSVPLTMIVKIIMESFDETRWLAILVGTNPEASGKR